VQRAGLLGFPADAIGKGAQVKRRVSPRSLLILAVALVLGACSATPPTTSGPGGSAPVGSGPQGSASSGPANLRIALALMPRFPNFDPALNSGSNPEFTNLYDALTYIERDGKLVPALAESWNRVDELTWEFKLRQGVTFHNGEPFTAAAVKFSFDRIQDPATQSVMKAFFNFVKEVVVVNDSTVRVVTKLPYGPAPLALARMFIVPPKLIADEGAEAFNAAPVGTGPYTWVEWRKGQSLVLEANKNYWNGAPAINRLTFLAAPEASTRIAMLLNGEADVIDGVLAADVPRIQGNANLAVLQNAPGQWVNYITIPTEKAPFNDKRVRQALNHAVDVDSIINQVLGGFATRTSVPLGSANFGYDASIAPYTFDLAQAKQLLQDAGNPTFEPMQIDVTDGFSPGSLQVAEAVAGYLTDLGVPTTVNPLPSADRLARNYSGQAGFSFHGNSGPTFDADSHYSVNFYSPDKGGRGIYYSSPEVDALIEKAQASSDAEVRKAAYYEIDRILYDEATDIFLYTSTYLYGARADLDWMPSKTIEMNFSDAKFK
jgi:peptide/nickel transport system substrate-binding protein